jgi:hypothetical protein
MTRESESDDMKTPPARFYIIKGFSSAFDGLVVVGGEEILDGDDDTKRLISIKEITRPGTIVGDRELRFPLPDDGMFIESGYLEPILDPGLREFDSTNPFGECMGESNSVRGGIGMMVTEYQNALHVSVRDLDVKRTIWDGYFFHEIESVLEAIRRVEYDGPADRSDVAFELDRIKLAFAAPDKNNGDQ